MSEDADDSAQFQGEKLRFQKGFILYFRHRNKYFQLKKYTTDFSTIFSFCLE